ncbi:hypothetical protein T484DRAFT_1856267 [Baffinella frigidus]|nr:hypothetical protein T484DRAFT_1856267 [Cryptophyta sp. CCMP2293]
MWDDYCAWACSSGMLYNIATNKGPPEAAFEDMVNYHVFMVNYHVFMVNYHVFMVNYHYTQ